MNFISKPILTWHLKNARVCLPVLASFSYVTDANRIDEADRQKIAR